MSHFSQRSCPVRGRGAEQTIEATQDNHGGTFGDSLGCGWWNTSTSADGNICHLKLERLENMGHSCKQPLQ